MKALYLSSWEGVTELDVPDGGPGFLPALTAATEGQVRWWERVIGPGTSPLTGPVLWVDEEARLKDAQVLNRAATMLAGQPIYGPCFVTGEDVGLPDGREPAALTDEAVAAVVAIVTLVAKALEDASRAFGGPLIRE